MRSATTSLRGHPHSVPEARRWTISTLSSWGLDVTAWSAAQVVSELATNCTLHARSDFEIRLSLEGQCLRVEAVDRLPGGPQARTYSSTSTTGRGLRIVEGLSRSWGVVSTAGGKTVWALLPVEDRPPARGDEQDDEQPRRAPAPTGASPAPAGPLALAAAA